MPEAHAAYRPLLMDGLRFFLERLSPSRQAAILAEQLRLPRATSPARRLAILFRRCPTLHKLGLAADAPGPVRSLNIGGDFGIPYFPGDAPLDLQPIAANLERWLPRVKKHLPKARVVLELGRYLVGEAGIYVVEVVDRKISRGHTFLIANGGLHHHLAASGNFGQVIRKNYPVVVGNRVVGTEREVVTVVGPLCTPLDILAERMELAKAGVGDLIVVFQSGAYGLTASPTAFLSHPACGEVVV